MLEGLFTQLAAKSPPPVIAVPPVPSVKNQREPLQAAEYKAVPLVPPVPPEKTETKTKNDKASLSATDRQKLLDYMSVIDETDPEMIDELLDECGKNPEAPAWALQWADKVLSNQVLTEQSLVTCRNCQHFQCYNDHVGGAGSCAAGISPMGVCHWSETHIECDKHQILTEKSI